MARIRFESFLELVRRSRLVEPEALDRVVDSLPRGADGRPTIDSQEFAQKLISQQLLTDWQANKLLEGRYKGFFVGRYKLLGHLGTGGMSAVYLAEHSRLKRLDAVKVLPSNRVNDSSYLDRFYREARAVAALDHRNIVRVYDVDNQENTHFLAMEYVDGRNLQDVVKEDGPLDYDLAANYTRQAAEGLSHAHQSNLIHRDVKPANLLVNSRGQVKVLDLGLARFLNEEQGSLTRQYDENVLGTADYLAPEQALDSHNVDARADVYSLGCTLYFLLTGHPPFPEGTIAQRLLKHQTEPPEPIVAKRPDAPPELVRICERMMAKKAVHRQQSMDEVIEELNAFLASRGIGSAGRPMPPVSSRRAEAELYSGRVGLRATGSGSSPGGSSAPSGSKAPGSADVSSSRVPLGPGASRLRPRGEPSDRPAGDTARNADDNTVAVPRQAPASALDDAELTLADSGVNLLKPAAAPEAPAKAPDGPAAPPPRVVLDNSSPFPEFAPLSKVLVQHGESRAGGTTLQPLPPDEPQGPPIALILGIVGVVAVVAAIAAAIVLSL